MTFSKQAQDAIDQWKAEAWRMQEERSLAVERLMERTAERDRARATAVAFEQQLDAVRAEQIASAAEIRDFPERHQHGTYEHGQYDEAIRTLSCLLEDTGEHYPGMESEDAAEALVEAFATGAVEHAHDRLPVALDLDDEAREEARLGELTGIAGWSA